MSRPRQLGLAVLLGTASFVAQAEDAWVAEARQLATSVPPKLLAVLNREIEQGGAVQAIGACQIQAPEMARQASAASGWTVRRVSLRERNPKARPDAWEQAALEDFDRRVAAGEVPMTLEKAERVDVAGVPTLRYVRALAVGPVCVQCHGDTAQMDAGVKAKLAALYPHDRATGYAVGQIRGVITLSKPAP
ncbi:DUF3365 domain-containing protein [Ideonella sp. 4Y11]|uniref:DUF3365 domain-containing protein n=1 Tax=Ideonella aquatica TaxID=2824119 RepID=A0A941BKU1_9BURK|nr:DUF3365 domain-containing protein [Ideonella aquatica]MBQ0960822.1 DUF3365 domain-containing protein [Ideonella aquatica]